MFTGIIEATGTLKSLHKTQAGWRMLIDTGRLDLGDVKIGHSIAVNGCCLTVVELDGNSFSADVSHETLRCTTLGSLSANSRVNLEKAMRAGDRFGGHIVSGHVDGVGKLTASAPEGRSLRLVFEAPRELAKYIAVKGSVCIDGASLTINTVDGASFGINVIPHTLEETVIGDYRAGQSVNLEVDLVARYLERLAQGDSVAPRQESAIDREFLVQHGFRSV